MDSTIQALVQSPYMRAMSVIPTKSEELVHGIHDHLPPVKKTSIFVDPEVRGGSSGRWIFGIPRRGLLHSLKLHIRPKCTSLNAATGTLAGNNYVEQGITAPYFRHHVGSITSHYASTMEYIELYSKQKFIERIYPECIVYANLHNEAKTSVRYCFDARQHTLGVIAEPTGSNGTEVPFPNLVRVAPEFYTGAASNNIRPHFIVPVPLSTFTSVKKNLQTYFVEPLTLVVKAQPFAYLPSNGYDMALVCEYHEFHPNVETALRNANYKQSIPASIPCHDWLLFDRRLNPADLTKRVYALDSDALISAFVVVSSFPASYGTDDGAGGYQYGTVATTATTFKNQMNMYVVVEANGEVLLEGSVQDFHEDYSCILNEDYGRKYPDIAEDSSLWYFSINLGLTTDNERFSGGLALSSLNNARMSIYPNKLVYTGGAFAASGGADDIFTRATFDLRVYAKRHFLLRIDSDTGVITRSIES